MGRILSDEGLAALVRREAMVLTVYRDVAGIDTVCVGHVVRPEDRSWVSDGVTRDECLRALGRDVQRFVRCVDRCLHVETTQEMDDAMISLAFNIGEAAFEKSSVVARVNERNYQAAGDAFLLWRFANVKQKDGSFVRKPVLLARRNEERLQFFSRYGSRTSQLPSSQEVASKMFDLRRLLDDRGREVVDNDERTADGRLVVEPVGDEVTWDVVA